MKYPTIFHLIASVFDKANISCVLIGGFAVNYYKATRQTIDVDFLITKEDFKKIVRFLEKEGFEQDYARDTFVGFNCKRYLINVDFMFVDNTTLNKIIEEGRRVKIAGQEFIIPSLEHLMALKLHSMKYNFKLRIAKDMPDIINLVRNNRIDIKSDKFKKLCLEFGTEQLYKKILEMF